MTIREFIDEITERKIDLESKLFCDCSEEEIEFIVDHNNGEIWLGVPSQFPDMTN